MEENNCFLEESQIDGSYQLRVKIKYLHDQKEQLQLSNQQMKQNITLLRHVNQQLSKLSYTNQHALIASLNQQNASLQSSYIRILDENKAFICKNLMLQQIIEEGEVQQREILRGYESKITELRRSIHFKQSCIQSYQQNSRLNNTFEMPNVSPSNISMVFFNQIDEYKHQIQQLSTKNKRLEKSIEQLTLKVNRLQQEKTFMDILIKSRQGFNQVRKRLNEEQLEKKCLILSEGKVPKSNYENRVSIANKKQAGSKMNRVGESLMKKGDKPTFLSSDGQQVQNQMIGEKNCINFIKLKQQLRKSNIELCKLSKAYKKQHQKRKQKEQKVRMLVNSNKFYKQKRITNTDELNYYKNTTTDLLKLLSKKKVQRSYSVDKTQIDNIISSIKHSKERSPLINFKQHWKFIQQQINHSLSQKTQLQLHTINNRKLKKSLSDVLNYLNPNSQTNQSYIKNQKLQKQQKHKKSMYEAKKQSSNSSLNDLDDFSRMLGLGVNGEVFDEQTFIIKPKVTYADRKKQKIKAKRRDPHDLTIITENIL